jgi:hypothetical protein
MDKAESENFLVRYLLGQVSQEERDAFEDQYLADREQFEELVAVENDLIDSYVHGELSGAEKESFERHFLSDPKRRERVDFAVALADQLNANADAALRATGPRASAFSWRWPRMRLAMAAAGIAVAAGIAWTVVNDFQLRRQLVQQQQEERRLRQQIDDLKTKLQETPGGGQKRDLARLAPPGSATISMVLAPLARGRGRQNIVFISPGISSISFSLNRPKETYSAYTALLETVEGIRLEVQNNLEEQPAADGKVVVVEFLSKGLRANDYVLKLQGMNPTGTFDELDAYSFRIVKR